LRRRQVFNADAQVHQDPVEVRRLMVGQLTGPVRWTQSIQRLQQLGADTYVEVGPRRTLTGLVKKILPGAVVHNIADLASMNTTPKTTPGGGLLGAGCPGHGWKPRHRSRPRRPLRPSRGIGRHYVQEPAGGG